jgi:hypothetical protein
MHCSLGLGIGKTLSNVEDKITTIGKAFISKARIEEKAENISTSNHTRRTCHS